MKLKNLIDKAMKMKKLLISACALLAGLGLRAQVVVLNDNLWVTRLAEIQATVVDSLTHEPVPYASFYVIPEKDTTITNFTLTDPEGKAKLEDVPLGRYTLHVEMMGYRPVVKSRYFRRGQSHRRQKRHGGIQCILVPGGSQCHAQGPAETDAGHGNHG